MSLPLLNRVDSQTALQDEKFNPDFSIQNRPDYHNSLSLVNKRHLNICEAEIIL
jgi:hypothetical protein